MTRAQTQRLMAQVHRDAQRIATRFGLRYRSLERANVKSRYGICYDDGTIKIRLCHAVSGEPLKYSSLINTLCHELAHLRHFNHGPRFKAFYLQLLEWSRSQGIYRPGRLGADGQVGPKRDLARRRPARVSQPAGSPPAGPAQLDLF